jgi:hypothetical protein
MIGDSLIIPIGDPDSPEFGVAQGDPTGSGFIPGTGVRPDNDTTPALNLVFPTFRTFAGGFRRATIPAGSPLCLPAGATSAWLSLINITISPALFGQEMLLVGDRLELLSADVEGTGGSAAWGDLNGMSAAIIMGHNLPIGPVGAWTQAPCFLPGVETLAAGVQFIGNDQHYLWDSFFPPGKSFTAGVGSGNKVVHGEDYPPFVRRLTYGIPFGVAFVWQSTQYNAIAAGGGVITGLVRVRVRLGQTRTEVTFSS